MINFPADIAVNLIRHHGVTCNKQDTRSHPRSGVCVFLCYRPTLSNGFTLQATWPRRLWCLEKLTFQTIRIV